MTYWTEFVQLASCGVLVSSNCGNLCGFALDMPAFFSIFLTESVPHWLSHNNPRMPMHHCWLMQFRTKRGKAWSMNSRGESLALCLPCSVAWSHFLFADTKIKCECSNLAVATAWMCNEKISDFLLCRWMIRSMSQWVQIFFNSAFVGRCKVAYEVAQSSSVLLSRCVVAHTGPYQRFQKKSKGGNCAHKGNEAEGATHGPIPEHFAVVGGLRQALASSASEKVHQDSWNLAISSKPVAGLAELAVRFAGIEDPGAMKLSAIWSPKAGPVKLPLERRPSEGLSSLIFIFTFWNSDC